MTGRPDLGVVGHDYEDVFPGKPRANAVSVGPFCTRFEPGLDERADHPRLLFAIVLVSLMLDREEEEAAPVERSWCMKSLALQTFEWAEPTLVELLRGEVTDRRMKAPSPLKKEAVLLAERRLTR